MTAWRNWHLRTSAWLRGPLKLLLFLLVVVFALYPNPVLMATWLRRITDVNSLVDRDHPQLAALETELRASLPPYLPPAAVLTRVEEVVERRLPYAWDWDTWGVADYWPTVDEAFRLGREDCDGRAVVAASLLRRLGYDARLATDFLHVWVETDRGRTMSPTSTDGALVSGPRGTEIHVAPVLFSGLARGLSYGVAKFPLGREIAIIVAACLLLMHPWSSFWRRVSGCLLMWTALTSLRATAAGAAITGDVASVWQTGAGIAALLAGVLVLAIKVEAGRPRSLPMPPG